MKDTTSRIVNSLNEAIESVESEPDVETSKPVEVHQCPTCSKFFLVTEGEEDTATCPDCGSLGKPYAKLQEMDETTAKKQEGPDLELTEEEEVELKSEADAIVDEALRTLDRGDYRKFNECYAPRTRITNKGKLEGLVESNGHVVTSSRRMTSRQKASYKLAEKYNVVSSTSKKSVKNEALKVKRQNLMIKNEARAIKIKAFQLLERQGAKYDFKKFNEGLSEFIKSRNYIPLIERINEDDEIGKSDLEKMTPDEIGDTVDSVVKDTGLDVISNEVNIDGETATATVTVQDSDGLEVSTDEIKDVLEDAFDAPVEIAGPAESEGDKSVQELAVIINPEDQKMEENDEDFPKDQSEEDDDEILSDEDKKKIESIRRKARRRNEALRRKNEANDDDMGNPPIDEDDDPEDDPDDPLEEDDDDLENELNLKKDECDDPKSKLKKESYRGKRGYSKN